MKKYLLIIIFLFPFYYTLSSQSEFHVSYGTESSSAMPFKSGFTQFSPNAGRGYQVAFQHIFNHVGIMIAYENIKRELHIDDNSTSKEISIIAGQGNSNRLMLYFVGRFKPHSNWMLDLRFGLGRLLNTKKDYYYVNPIMNGIQTFIPGLSFAFGFKTQYKLFQRFGIFVDLNYSITPYSYRYYKDSIWYPHFENKSSFVSNLGFSVGLSITLEKKNK